jgi:cytochrome oxidase assembly protein ShyY1
VSVRKSRGLIVPALLTISVLAILIGLGVWQFQRKAWKEELIASVTQRVSAPPVALPSPREWGGLNQTDDEFRRVAFPAEFLSEKEALVYTTGSAFRTDVSGQGHWVFTPARVPGGLVMINRGFIPGAERPKEGGAARRVSGVVNVVGAMRWPEATGTLSPKADVERNVWFVRDHLSIATTKGIGTVAPFYIEQESPMPPGGLPRPGRLTVNLSNYHLGYALTWFGLAGVLLIVFFVWAKGGGRKAPDGKRGRGSSL